MEKLFVDFTEQHLLQGRHDLPQKLTVLVNSAYRGESSREGWTTEAEHLGGQRTDEEELRTILENPQNRVLGYISSADGALLGCVRLVRESATTSYLGMLTVSPRLQARGMGRELLEAAERWVTENWGSREMRMRVITLRLTLLDWYLRRGYEMTDQYEDFPYGDPRQGLPLRDDLKFRVLRKELRGTTESQNR